MYGLASLVRPSISLMSGATPEPGRGRRQVAAPAVPGLPSQAPSRALNSASRKVSVGEEAAPMFGLTAAPEIVMALPSEMAPAYAAAGR